MKTPRQILQQKMQGALTAAYPDAAVPTEDLVFPTASPEHGDYQCNRALQMARQARANPRAVAERLIAHATLDDIGVQAEISGPGFINFRLDATRLGEELRARLGDARLGIETVSPAQTIVVDYSSPNVAKPMHVGHIRSTIIGDVIARLLRFLGHRVVGDNHLGDWGTQFGLLLTGFREFGDETALKSDATGELKRVYLLANQRAKDDEAWAERARQELARLQAGDEANRALWQHFIDLSRDAFERIYRRLAVHFDTWHGESFYNPLLGDVIADLERCGLARESDGALVIFFDDPEELRERPMLVRKTDGASLYATTDLAAVRYRMETYHPATMVYVTDGRQQLHFKQLFEAARRWGYTDVKFEHVWFGTILGPDNRPIKTREGEPVELEALLDEAEERAMTVVREKQPELAEAVQREVARVVGIGAVKYADLAQNRTSDYVFSWDKMLAMQGNTGPYLQYACVRINSILERAGATGADLEAHPPQIVLEQAAELALGKVLVRFADVLTEAANSYKPNLLTTGLYDLASAFSVFYESCPVVSSAEPQRASRLALCHLTGCTLHQGLDLLGIETLPRM